VELLQVIRLENFKKVARSFYFKAYILRSIKYNGKNIIFSNGLVSVYQQLI
jgi:hypothetical protein